MDCLKKEDWDRQDILAIIRKRKKSLSALSVENGLSFGTLSNALVRPWTKGERIIADVIGVTPEDIWPSRYLGIVRKERKISKKVVIS